MGARLARRASAPLRVVDVGRVGDVGATRHFDDAAYYDTAYRKRRDDVRFYTRMAKTAGGPVLEYGIGTGRIGLAIARAGIHVTGLDRSAPMLAELRKKLGRESPEVRRRIRAIRADMRTAKLGRRF